MVKLNNSAAAIMTRCDGVRTVADIVADIERTYAVTGLAGDVGAFVAMARDNRWLELRE
jgi:pyrroloquinoline quinone biosynthesis protein D